MAVGGYLLYNASHASTQPELKSGIGGSITKDTPGTECLEWAVRGNAGNNIATLNPCSGTYYQDYAYLSNGEVALGNGCLVEQGASRTAGVNTPANVTVDACSTGAPPYGGAWTKAGAQFHSNHDGSSWCLTYDSSRGDLIDIRKCQAGNANADQRWFPATYYPIQVL